MPHLNKNRVLIIGGILGVLLFLLDSRGTLLRRFDSVSIGMARGDAAILLRDSDSVVCSATFDRAENDCSFSDTFRSYRIVFDPKTDRVIAKFTWLRRPQSLLDRLGLT
jgi:hypothetical protein